MKVLHIIDTLWLGGAQTLERDFFEAQKDNENIFLYALRKSDPQIAIHHKNVFIRDSYSRYGFSPLREIKKIIREHNIEILHCHLLRSHFFGYLLKKFFFPKIRLIIHEHADIIDNAALAVPLLKWMRNRADLFIACSNDLKKELAEKINPAEGKVVTLYNAIDLRKFNRQVIAWDVSKERQRNGIEENVFVVGFAGRLTKRKGWEEVVEAARLLKEDRTIKFIIAGDGEDKEKLLHLKSIYGLDNLIYAGYISEMQKFYSLLNCLVVPSHHEPMGMIVIEAQAMEIPVIASDVNGLNEVVTDGGNALLCQPKNAGEIKQRILKLRSDIDLYTQLKANGLENAKKYSIENYIKKVSAIYSEIS